MNTVDSHQCLSTEQVSEMLAVDVQTLYSWRHKGDGGPTSFKIGSRLVYRAVDVYAWLDAQYAATARQAS